VVQVAGDLQLATEPVEVETSPMIDSWGHLRTTLRPLGFLCQEDVAEGTRADRFDDRELVEFRARLHLSRGHENNLRHRLRVSGRCPASRTADEPLAVALSRLRRDQASLTSLFARLSPGACARRLDDLARGDVAPQPVRAEQERVIGVEAFRWTSTRTVDVAAGPIW